MFIDVPIINFPLLIYFTLFYLFIYIYDSTTLAENAGLNPIEIVTDLRNKHENGEREAGISVRRSGATNTYSEHVLQPVLVNTSAITLSSETIKSILRIDDIAISR